ncbi:MAG: SDR family oxidoreductase [Solirubrobacterales bacterium]|nr:SDR family oxidoreductase [Solirubrobacterales bacterium]MBV9807955.1 SDR family oxidoreductase [Solirubrobacterales bacterium]
MGNLDLTGATAIVTGGSRGIGPYIAEALAGQGARVALVARSESELEANARRLADAGGEVIAVPADITSARARRELIEAVERRLDPVDILVNNAGGDLQREFHNLTEEEVQGLLELNLTSAVLLTRLVLPGMLGRGRGHVVNVSSMAGRVSFPYTEAYAAAKDGLIGFTRVLRADYRRRGVSASTLILGPVGEAGVGARTAEEVGIKLPPVGLVSPAKIGKETVRAIRRDKRELVVLPGPGKLLRAVMDRSPGLGPAINRVSGTSRTMRTVVEYREREARLAAAGRGARQRRTAGETW